ncbi:hypothetical protein W03_14670 [Nitrosomonas sp. PY1]|uniref:hypothetical protein n=1 Tax=Nitrosomonas sp. PY1 TaxID=1803906 RepID=UPI001FC898BE|nr:hypothetical protein [Nitrosomonas sp. PY1]GKS69463.1 hypothetical protein W03_14670 [Nitrosomonas sp. PY1]
MRRIKTAIIADEVLYATGPSSLDIQQIIFKLKDCVVLCFLVDALNTLANDSAKRSKSPS